MTSIEQIDAVLKYMSSGGIVPVILDVSIEEIYKGINKEKEIISEKDLQRILHKLIKDKYIEEKYLYNMGFYYSATWDGRYFYENGGYGGEIDANNRENIRLVNLEKSTRVNRIFQTWLAVFVALGTLISAFFYAIEIYKYYK